MTFLMDFILENKINITKIKLLLDGTQSEKKKCLEKIYKFDINMINN
jgi:hypothetical protein